MMILKVGPAPVVLWALGAGALLFIVSLLTGVVTVSRVRRKWFILDDRLFLFGLAVIEDDCVMVHFLLIGAVFKNGMACVQFLCWFFYIGKPKEEL